MSSIKITITPKSILMIIFFTLLTWIVFKSIDVILLLFISFIIASALFPTVDWLSKKMPRGLAVSIVYLVGIILLSTLLVPLFTILIQQTQEFIKQIPSYIGAIDKFTASWRIASRGFSHFIDLSKILPTSLTLGQNIVSQSINLTVNIVTGIVAAFTLAIVVLFLLLDKEEVGKGVLKLFPSDKQDNAKLIIITISKRVGGYVRGQLLLMLAVGILTALGLMLIHVQFALLLGLVAAILEIVPIIGPILAAVPAVIVALAQNPVLALWVILVYLIVQRIENSLLAPLILSKFLDLHPLLIIVALLICASTLGVIGAILAPAIAAAVYVLVQELYINKINKPVNLD